MTTIVHKTGSLLHLVNWVETQNRQVASVAHTPLLIFCYLIGKLKHFRQKYGMLWSSNMLIFHFIKRDKIPGNRGCVHAEEAGRGSFVSRARERGSPSPTLPPALGCSDTLCGERPPTSEAVIELRPPPPPPPHLARSGLTSALSLALFVTMGLFAWSQNRKQTATVEPWNSDLVIGSLRELSCQNVILSFLHTLLTLIFDFF